MGEERYQEVREALVWKESIGMNREAQEVWHDAGTDRLGPVAEEQDGSQRCRYELVDDAERDGNCRYHCALVGEEHDGAALTYGPLDNFMSVVGSVGSGAEWATGEKAPCNAYTCMYIHL